MYGQPGVNFFQSKQLVGNNFTAIPGVVVTPGASSTEGAWTAWATTAVDVYGVFIRIANVATASLIKMQLLDIGVDPAGGTAYTPLVSDLVCGNAGNNLQGGYQYYFPISIKAGSSIAVRAQCSNATAADCRVYGILYGRPSNPEAIWTGTFSKTLGVTTGTAGTGVAAGTVVNVPGNYVAIGTTTHNMKYWQVGLQYSVAGTVVLYQIDVAYGNGTAFNEILSKVNGVHSNSPAPASTYQRLHPESWCYCDVPAGSTIYARVSSSIAGAQTGTPWNVTVVGVG